MAYSQLQGLGTVVQNLLDGRACCTDRTAQTIIAGHAFMPNVRHGHYELGVDAPCRLRIATEPVKIVETRSV